MIFWLNDHVVSCSEESILFVGERVIEALTDEGCKSFATRAALHTGASRSNRYTIPAMNVRMSIVPISFTGGAVGLFRVWFEGSQ